MELIRQQMEVVRRAHADFCNKVDGDSLNRLHAALFKLYDMMEGKTQ